jgi:MFS family permease
MLTLGGIFVGMIFPAVSVHIIPYLTDLGMDPVAAAVAMGFMVLMSTPGRLIGGMIGDRLHKDKIKYLMVLSAVSYSLGMLTLVLTQKLLMVYISLFLFGTGVGINSSRNPVIIGRYFGRKRYGTISGLIAMIGLPVSLISPIFAGWSYDVTGSYADAFKLDLVLGVFGVIFYMLAKPPEKPEELNFS